MKWMLRSFLVLLVPLQLSATEPSGIAKTPVDLEKAVEKLSISLDRLAMLLEKDAAVRAEEREARRVELAVAVMGLRYRKIDRLEGEIQQMGREEEEFAKQIKLMNAEAEQLRNQGRTERGQVSEQAKGAIGEVELRIRLEEERIAGLGERKAALQNDLTAEQRRLVSVQAILDAWMEKQ